MLVGLRIGRADNSTMSLFSFVLRVASSPALLSLLLSGLWPSLVAATDRPPEPTTSGIGREEAGARVPMAEIYRYVAVFRAVRDAYVEDVDDRALMQAAIRGLLTDLDPHSAYLDKEQTADVDELSSGAYDGVGLELVQQPDRSLLVIAPIDGTPAARAGFRPGDLIVAIDGEPIQADSADQAVADLRAELGTRVVLTVLREGSSAPLELTVVRETIRIVSVLGRLLEPGYGYVRISAFQNDTAPELRRKLEELAGEGPLRGLVLDLRGNPGGLLEAAVRAADTFIDAGADGAQAPLIVSTRGRQAFANSEHRARPGDLLDGAPMVALIDSGSASAAEVLAGALRDHGRALLMGERSFGKGSVQTIVPLDNGDAIKLTTARYYTPSGRDIQAAGIAPDIVISERTPGLRERDLPGHLHGENEDAALEADADRADSEPDAPSPEKTEPTGEAAGEETSEAEGVGRDPVVREALKALKRGIDAVPPARPVKE